MTENIFFTTDQINPERLSWLVEIIKFYITKLHPDSLHHHTQTSTIPFDFFLSGDACYSLIDHQCLPYWEILFSMPSFRCTCDADELNLRGISLNPQILKHPGSVFIPGSHGIDTRGSFWDRIIGTLMTNHISESAGFLHLQSPYMHRSPVYTINFLSSAIKKGLSPELYGYLDGVYIAHSNQQPSQYEDIGGSLQIIHKNASEMGLTPFFVAESSSATDRGYPMVKNEKGKIISSCTISSVKILDLDKIISRFQKDHPIMSHCSLLIKTDRTKRFPMIKKNEIPDPPALVVLISKSPYGTEMTNSALSFAVMSAYHGIHTRVVFIEEGVYAVTGQHSVEESEPGFNIQDLLGRVSDLDNLELFAYNPSFHLRGISIHKTLKGILTINAPEFANILLKQPAGSKADHQRVILF
jgi:tRNA 2-thiouridine synthesizing protein C